jgi:uncharacterized protein (DUF169 family)
VKLNDKEANVNSSKRDYSAFDRLNLERKPVGVKFLPTKPDGIERIKKKVALCEMFIEAQEKGPFYVQKEDFLCVEPLVLGMVDPEPVLQSGLAGGMAGLYQEVRANRKVYQYIPKMLKGSVNYVAFSPVDQITFDPDVLIITTNVSQARTVLRSECYSSGEMWSCQGTPIIACAWLYVYPVISGKMNFTVTGLSLGMQAINAQIPEGLFLISVPWNLLPTVLENLKDENMYKDWRSSGREEHFAKFDTHCEELRKKMPNY